MKRGFHTFQLRRLRLLAPVKTHLKFETPKEKETSKLFPWLNLTLTPDDVN